MKMYTRHYQHTKTNKSCTNSKPLACGSRKRGSYELQQCDIDFLYKYNLEQFITKHDIELIEWRYKNEMEN